MPNTNIYRTWCKRIESGTFTKSQCQQWAKAVVPIARGWRPEGKATVLTPNEASDLMTRMEQTERGGVTLTTGHTRQGVEWLRRDGTVLSTEELDKFSYFEFRGEMDYMDWGTYFTPQGPRGCIPVWRIVLMDGTAIDYSAQAWQAGGMVATVKRRSVTT